MFGESAKGSRSTKGNRNDRLLSLNSMDVFEDTFSITDDRISSPCKLSYLAISVILVLIVLIVLLPVFNHRLILNPTDNIKDPPPICRDPCQVSLVESIPEGLLYNSSVSRQSTYSAWKELLNLSESSIELAGMYWTLRGSDVFSHPSDWQGEDIFKNIKSVVSERGIKLRIAQNQPSKGQPNLDTEDLQRTVGAEVRNLDFTRLMGAGILHTKLWLVDNKHFYVGSANFDWRSLTQVKEVGVLVKNCPCLAEDIAKIWEVYWELGAPGAVVPSAWPASLSTQINTLMPVSVVNPELSVSISSSPPPFCPQGRDSDIAAILDIISSAKQVVRVAVMDYFPATIYTSNTTFWPLIDDALRKAAVERGVRVELLMSEWDHTRPAMIKYLASLQALDGVTHNTHIKVRLFRVPATADQAKIPFGRVNHNKYLVTEQKGFVGTSNWSADYFISTGGIGFVFSGPLRDELDNIFTRDWNSSYSRDL